MTERRKILYVRGTSANFGGIESQIALLAGAAAAKGAFEPALLTTDPASLLSEKFRGMGLKVHILPMGRFGALGAAGALAAEIDFGAVAAVESHMFRESFYGRALKRRFPHLIHAHRAHTYIDCSWIPEWKKRAYHLADRATAGYVDAYWANGDYLKTELVSRSGIPAAKIRVILNGTEPLDASAASGGAGPIPPAVVMVANLLPHKGHDVLIEALGLMKAKGLSVAARLVGSLTADPAHVARLKDLARERGVLDALDFRGFTEDLAAAVRGIDVLVLPSDSEGLPLCVLEGMSLRKLVVASRVGAVPECVSDGENGFLHPPKDPAALAAILERLFAAPAGAWKPVMDAAAATWASRFSRDRMLAEFGRAYREAFGLDVY